ncbi:uncharacterized protein LOC125455306 isoform X2 [Stegostoma tigrinum]|uniref:uncharacterized protein LOC125455306 isoform X2 n=1 Tax=Stegostoma tigrinum TaxID=3053191 RepID=UPI0028702733|nr:uncharacterized protein LOC125455306 isoform X2 [Stegostoma tigrinum]
MITVVINCQERSAAVRLRQDEENDDTNNFPQNMVECLMKQKRINGNMEISVPFDDCGLNVRNPCVNQNCMEEQDLCKVLENQGDTTTILATEKAFSSEALDPNDSTNDSTIGCMRDPISNRKHILNGANLMRMKKDMLLNASTSKTLCMAKDEENNELWSDFAGYGQTSLVQQQFFGTLHELPLREDSSAEKSFQCHSSKIPNDNFANHHFPTHHHNPTNYKHDNELQTSASVINASAPQCSMLKLNSSVNAEEDLLRYSNLDQPAVFVNNNFADSAINWTFGSNGQLVNDTLQTLNWNETEFSGLGSPGELCPVNPPFSENQAILSASSALKADTRNHLINILQNSFPSEPIKHSFEDIPTLEKLLEVNGKECDANKAKTSPEFPTMWEDIQDLNSLSLRSSWNVSHSREKLFSTLGIDQNQKDVGQSKLQFLEETVACGSDLERTSALPEVATVPENGNRALIQTRIPATPPPRTSRSFTHRVETVVIQWLQMNGNRVREVPRVRKKSLFL